MGLEGETPQDSPGRVEGGKEEVRQGVGGGDRRTGKPGENQPLCVLILQHLRQPQANVRVLRCHFARVRVKLQHAACLHIYSFNDYFSAPSYARPGG